MTSDLMEVHEGRGVETVFQTWLVKKEKSNIRMKDLH